MAHNVENAKRPRRASRRSKLSYKDLNDGKDAEENDPMTETASTSASSGRLRIAFKPLSNDKGRNFVNESYQECRDQICAICAKEAEDESGHPTNLFRDATASGTSTMASLLRVILRRDVNPSTFASRICADCADAINDVEKHYLNFRRATDSVLDAFIVGQRLLDADALAHADAKVGKDVTAFVNLSKFYVKILDATVANFNAIAVDDDFGLANSVKIIRASTSMPPSASEAASAPVTLPLDSALPQVYMTQEEFDGLQVKVTETGSTTYINEQSLAKVVPKLLLGHKNRHQFLLSANITRAFCQQIPSSRSASSSSAFVCSDCFASFEFLHPLSNHVESAHVAGKQDTKGDFVLAIRGNGADALKRASSGCKRTGEVASLDKPFQCEHCDKCFGQYSSLSTHVDHYHGFSRACNVEDCGKTFDSIIDYVSHYVSHSDPKLELPADFKAKTKVVLPCPMCSISIQGVWKYFQHTFTHDKLGRFRCPACNKRTHKVQNFKEHLVRHHRAGGGIKIQATKIASPSSTELLSTTVIVDVDKDDFARGGGGEEHVVVEESVGGGEANIIIVQTIEGEDGETVTFAAE